MIAAAPVAAPALRLGNYELLRELASGGMATVYVARQVGAAGFERLVVVKRVHPHLLKDREFSDMLRDEARVCATIRHPNVVQVNDVVEAEGELFLVLEYVESMPLSALVRAATSRGQRLAPAVVSRILADALAGLHAAHEAVDLRGNPLDLIHRDVSPQNIIVGADGTSRLIDFGIARAASRISVTNSGIVKGKLRYMSPEQVQQKLLDRRADVFSAGIVLYEALTGARPFAGEDDGDVVLGVLIGEFSPPSSFVGGLPAAVDAVLLDALARPRDERYATAHDFQVALEHAILPAPARDVAAVVQEYAGPELASRRAELRQALESAATAATATGDSITAVAVDLSRGRSRLAPVLGALAALIVTAAIAIVLVFALRHRPPSASSTEGTPPPSAVAGSPPLVASTTAEVPAIALSAEPAPVGSRSPSHSLRPSRTDRPRTIPSSDLHRRNPYGAP